MADFISREIAIARLTAMEVTRPLASIVDAKRVLADMPAADAVAVVHGRWEETALEKVDSNGEIYRIPNAGLRCPWCMCAFDKKLLWRDSYCPNCGAKMGSAE